VSPCRRELFAAEPASIIAAFLFGSLARGNAHARSDVDVAVLYADTPPATLEGWPLDLESRISRLVGRPISSPFLPATGAGPSPRRDRPRSPPAEARLHGDVRPRAPRTLARPAEIQRDVREARFVLHTPQTDIHAAIDVASHIVSDERLGEPETNRELFDRLARHGWLPAELAETIERMVGFRNIVVHGYAGVNLKIAQDVVEHRLGDLLAFVALSDAGAAGSTPRA
jgi:uncharacterized protein YutE (UPF0331/DUF86 family)